MIALQDCLLTNMSTTSIFQLASSVDSETPRTKRQYKDVFFKFWKVCIFFTEKNMSYYFVKISNNYCQLLFRICLITDKHLLIQVIKCKRFLVNVTCKSITLLLLQNSQNLHFKLFTILRKHFQQQCASGDFLIFLMFEFYGSFFYDEVFAILWSSVSCQALY